MFKTRFTIFFLLVSFSTFAQKSAKEWYKDADAYFQKQRFEKAYNAYIEGLKLDPTKTEVFAKIGASACEKGAFEEAKKYLTIALEQKKIDEKTYFYLGKTAQNNSEFKDAVIHYKKYLTLIKSSAPDRRMVKDEIKRCAAGLNFPDNSTKVFVQNMGEQANSLFDDFAPVVSPTSDEKIYFSSSREGAVGGRRNEEGLRDEKFGTFCADMFSTKIVNGDWSEPKALSYLINSPRHDVLLDFSSDGQQMYYFRGYNLLGGEILVDTFKTFEDRTLNSTPFKSPMLVEIGDGTPYFVNDTMLIFSSRRPGGYGGLDLYYTLFQNGTWQEAVNLGKSINSAYDETTPFLAINGRTLYFSSNNTRGIGDFDIYKSTFDDEKLVWTMPENLGIPINSAGEDAFFRLNSDGSKGFFSSKRKDGFGERDLYIAYYKNPLLEQDNVSVPDLFFKVKKKNAVIDNENSDENVVKVVNYRFSNLLYDKDADLVSAKNRNTLDNMVAFLTKNPTVKVSIVSHSEETSTLDLDAFLSVKRAEKISEYLVKNGCNANQIAVLGCGSSFPIALNNTDGNVNKTGQKFNRRIDLFFANYQKLPVKLDFDDQIIPDYLQSGEYFRFKNVYKGLSYRVQIANMKQMYQGDVLKKYPDVTVEKAPLSDSYDFCIGIFNNFANAERLQKDLTSQGLTSVKIIPYISGFSVAENAKSFLTQYPDLQNFINKKK
jgi:outer membrane protein OmpA-like peptidoglycan-associated protein